MKWFLGQIGAVFTAIWVFLQIMTGQKKVLALKKEKPPVPLVVFRQSSPIFIMWPVVILTWVLAILLAVFKPETGEVPNWLFTIQDVWALSVIVFVLIIRVQMRAPLTIAIVALLLVFYLFMDSIGSWVPFLGFLKKLEIRGNWGIYAFLALIASVDIFIVWLYARFHYFIATPNKGFLVWGWFASERPIEYTEYDVDMDVEDVVERTFGFGTFKLQHKSDDRKNIDFPHVFRISSKMSKFNELTTELRVKAIHVDENGNQEKT